MGEIARLTGPSDAIELDFVRRIYTPNPATKLGIHLHLTGLSLSNTVSILENIGVERCRSTVHHWVKQVDLELRDGRSTDKIALDETVVKSDGEQHWLFAAVDPETNVILHVRAYTARTTVATMLFLQELAEKQYIEEDEFSSTVHRGSTPACSNSACIFDMKPTAIGTRPNVSFRKSNVGLTSFTITIRTPIQKPSTHGSKRSLSPKNSLFEQRRVSCCVGKTLY